jgi:hypothetical protein
VAGGVVGLEAMGEMKLKRNDRYTLNAGVARVMLRAALCGMASCAYARGSTCVRVQKGIRHSVCMHPPHGMPSAHGECRL